MDLRLTIQEEAQHKPLQSRWVPSHRDMAKAKTTVWLTCWTVVFLWVPLGHATFCCV